MKRPGVSLFEVVLSLSISVFLLNLSLSGFYFYKKQLTENSRQTDYLLNAAIALEHLARDMNTQESSSLKYIHESACIFSSSKGDIGWFFTKGRLMRIEGNYSIQSNAWTRKTVSMVLTNVHKVSFKKGPTRGEFAMLIVEIIKRAGMKPLQLKLAVSVL